MYLGKTEKCIASLAVNYPARVLTHKRILFREPSLSNFLKRKTQKIKNIEIFASPSLKYFPINLDVEISQSLQIFRSIFFKFIHLPYINASTRKKKKVKKPIFLRNVEHFSIQVYFEGACVNI